MQSWLNNGSLSGKQNSASQLAVPVSGDQGQILGVLYAAHQQPDAITDTELIEWIALAMVATPLLYNLHDAVAHIKG